MTCVSFVCRVNHWEGEGKKNNCEDRKWRLNSRGRIRRKLSRVLHESLEKMHEAEKVQNDHARNTHVRTFVRACVHPHTHGNVHGHTCIEAHKLNVFLGGSISMQGFT